MTVNGRSVAYAQAELMATAVVNAVASSAVCERCSSRATLEARKVTTEILSAVAVAELDLKDSSAGGDRKLAVDEFAETVVKGTATAVGEVSASYRAAVGAGWLPAAIVVFSRVYVCSAYSATLVICREPREQTNVHFMKLPTPRFCHEQQELVPSNDHSQN